MQGSNFVFSEGQLELERSVVYNYYNLEVVEVWYFFLQSVFLIYIYMKMGVFDVVIIQEVFVEVDLGYFICLYLCRV